MPALFAVGLHPLGSTQIALFAAFGALATMMLVDFAGPTHERLQSMVSLAIGGALMITLGTLTSVNAWLAAAAMLAVGFAVLFAGCVSSVLVSASFALLLSFILPVCLPGSAADIPARLAGWGMSAAVAMVAIAVLWPEPENGRLREYARRTCEALAQCLDCDAAHLRGGPDRPSGAQRKACFDRVGAAVSDLQSFFLATSSRPTDLTTQGRLLVRMVDELSWLSAVLRTDQEPPAGGVADAVAAVRSAAAAVLARSAAGLAQRGASSGELATALGMLDAAQRRLEDAVLRELPQASQLQLTSALAPSFRTREVGYAASLVGANVSGILVAERRGWWERLLGREPEGVLTPWRAARERAAAHWRRQSVWMHNSIRGAIALALAVWVANDVGLQHAFWVVLGTLSVLRSNALNTGQLVLRGIVGTILGFIVGAAILLAVGTDTRALWAVLPLAVLGAGLAPAAISFAAGQAAFTVTLVVLFNILEPAGWKVGLVRVEDVAIGCGISLLVGLLLWPRGAAAALRSALADAYAVCAGYVDEAVELGLQPPARRSPQPVDEAGTARAAAAARRLDDAFRTYLCERASKPVPVTAIARLVSGVTALRVNGGALIELWRSGDAVAPRTATAGEELRLASRRLRDWYGELARGIAGPAPVPEPLPGDDAGAARLVDSLHRHLGDPAPDGAAVVHLIWTADHLDALRRLQVLLVDPARRAAGVR